MPEPNYFKKCKKPSTELNTKLKNRSATITYEKHQIERETPTV